MNTEIYTTLESSFAAMLRELPLSTIHILRRGFSKPDQRPTRRSRRGRMCDDCIHGTHNFADHQCSCVCDGIAQMERRA